MITAALIVAALAALLHVYIFTMESLTWTSPRTRATFGTTPEEAETTKLLAFNQGFYNLFLALGVVGGLILVDFASGGAVSAGIGITKFALASMVLAGAVLLATGRRFRSAALMQAVPPALALLASTLA